MKNLLPDYTKLFDWSDPALTKEDIQLRFVGGVDYRNHERFKQPSGRQAHPLAIERSIMRKFRDSENYDEVYELSGLTWAEHFLRYMVQLYRPVQGRKFFVTPAVRQAAEALQYCLVNGIDFTNLIGSQSSGKSYMMALMCWALFLLDPDYSVIFVSAPYKTSGQSTIWGDMKNTYHWLKKAHPTLMGECELTDSKDVMKFPGEREKAGKVELITIDKVGKLKGAKAENPERGYFIKVADELNEYPTDAFIFIIENVTSNENFIGMTACNFKSVEGVDGQMCKPLNRPFESLKADEDHTWLSENNSLTVRIDGEKNPNYLAKRNVYNKTGLLSYEKYTAKKKSYSKLAYWSQLRSFPVSSERYNYVLAKEEIRSGGAYQEEVQEVGRMTRVAAMDPAFGGEDHCEIGVFDCGTVRVLGLQGQWVNIEVLMPVVPLIALDIDPLLVCDNSYLQQARSVVDENVILIPGEKVDVDTQIAIEAKKVLNQYGVSFGNFGFDASMRGGVTKKVLTLISTDCIPMDYGAAPRGYTLPDGTNTGDLYSNRVAEMYFGFAALVRGGQVRGAGLMELGLAEICRRKWENAGRKKKLEAKKIFKENNGGKSPDHGDVVCMASDVALTRGAIRFADMKHSHGGFSNSTDYEEMLEAGGNFLKTARIPRSL